MTFISERKVGSVRKRHLCEGCDTYIEPGEAAVNWCGLTDGDFGSAYYHPECRVAEIAYNNDYLGCRAGDEWWPIHDCDSDDRPWIKANHPVAYLRMCRTREQQAAFVLATRENGGAA